MKTTANIVLSALDAERFLYSLNHPPAPNSVLKRAAEDYKRTIEEGMVVEKEDDSNKNRRRTVAG